MFYGTTSGVKVFDLAGLPEADLAEPLSVRDLCGRALVEFPSIDAWTLDGVIARLSDVQVREIVLEAGGADAFLGSSWIGGTEV
ncbi:MULTISPECIES: hypothetical protein [Burkholderia]|uniref:hypothetical protein n=1 Tax=Burkholderia TaxID=32008 RepID=UPI001C8AB407|nr:MULTISPECIES: hypothetical protein [Burkholderia]MDD1493973.1 hypothetical protein [Burkholderia thailandensis]